MNFITKVTSQLSRIFGAEVAADTEDELLNALEGMDPIQSRIDNAIEGAANSSSENISALKSELEEKISNLSEVVEGFKSTVSDLQQKLSDVEEVRASEKEELEGKLDSHSKEIAKLKGSQTPPPEGTNLPQGKTSRESDEEDAVITMSFDEFRYGKTR